MLAALVEASGAVVADVRSARDDTEALEEAMRTAFASAEVLILSGGVSVGERDFVKPALAKLGVETNFWRVAIKPGRPVAMGVIKAGKKNGAAFVGLPGNPVAAFVTFASRARVAIVEASWTQRSAF